MGRSRKYRSAKEFADAVENYFDKITYKAAARHPDTWVSGKYIPGGPITNDAGEPIVITKYVVPPSVIGIQNCIGVSRETWSNYSEIPAYAEVIEYARRRIEEYLNQMLIEMGRDNKGVIFSLENNFGYREKRDDTVHQTTADISDTLTPEEKLAALKKLSLIAEEPQEASGDDP